jgi:hypothetical protein
MIIWIVIYLVGCILAYTMLFVEHQAENPDITIGDRALCLLLCFLSFVMVLIQLSIGWVKHVGRTGYWQRSIKPKPKEQ